MADISKLEQQADLLMQNVSGWETSTLERIGKRIKKYGKLSLADVKAINNIAVVKSDMDAITKELAKVTGYNISQIEQMYGELLEEQHLANQPLYDYRGKKFVPFKDNRELQAIARAYAKTTGETMINLAKTKALCVLGANGKPIGMQKYYTDVLDKAVMQVTTGATDFHTAMRDSIIELGGSGVRVDYGGGVTRRLDTVVRQNLLWGAKQASVQYNEMIGEELGCDGYEVDWHSNPRPSHEFMQGKQFAVGKARTINGIHFESADEALKRLQDYGCLHYKTPIICGISEPRYSSEELKRLNEQNARRYTIDGKEYSGYEVTQMQRRLESSVRNEKTTRELARASGDNALVKRCNERIKAYQTKYNEISEITGIQGDKKRMSVPRKPKAVDSVAPTIKTDVDSTSVQKSLLSKGFSEDTAKDIQARINALSGMERDRWEDAFSRQEYIVEDSISTAYCDKSDNVVHIARGEKSNITIHETAHAIAKDSVDYKTEYWSTTRAPSLLEEIQDQKIAKNDWVNPDVQSFSEKIGAKLKINGWFADRDEVFEKTMSWSKQYRGNDGFEAVSDILSGLTQDWTGGSIYSGGHSESYWQQPASRGFASNYYEESWANYCLLRFTRNKEMLDLLDGVAPSISSDLAKVYKEVFGK